MFLGGEFYSDPRWLTAAPTLSTEGLYFLNGGRACLTVIAAYLLDHGIDRILLPSYLCPSIVVTLERAGLLCEYYPGQTGPFHRPGRPSQKIGAFKAVYFINYFGFLHSSRTLEFLQSHQRRGVLLVEDNAQAGFSDHPTGDFIFNSIRKLIGYDGGYLTTAQDMAPYIEKYAGLPNRRLPVVREYRQRLYHYLFEDQGRHADLEALFEQSEQFYDTDLIVEGDPQERAQIERLDWKGIKQIRRDNYACLLGLIASIPEITPLFPALQPDNMPLGLPVYIKGVARDRVYEELGNASIGLTIHWEDIAAHPRTAATAWRLRWPAAC